MKFDTWAHILSPIGTLNALKLKQKKSFHRSINAIFGKVGRIASEEVNLHLVKNQMSPNFTLRTRVLGPLSLK